MRVWRGRDETRPRRAVENVKVCAQPAAEPQDRGRPRVCRREAKRRGLGEALPGERRFPTRATEGGAARPRPAACRPRERRREPAAAQGRGTARREVAITAGRHAPGTMGVGGRRQGRPMSEAVAPRMRGHSFSLGPIKRSAVCPNIRTPLSRPSTGTFGGFAETSSVAAWHATVALHHLSVRRPSFHVVAFGCAVA